MELWVFLYFLVASVVGGLATKYVVEYWCKHINGWSEGQPMILYIVSGAVVGWLSIVLAIYTYLYFRARDVK
jgi:H+/Cl- antiporter ClcA